MLTLSCYGRKASPYSGVRADRVFPGMKPAKRKFKLGPKHRNSVNLRRKVQPGSSCAQGQTDGALEKGQSEL